MAGTSQ